jgi:amino acid transporter
MNEEKGMRLSSLIMIAIGMVIGSGVVSLIGPAIAMTGRSAGLAYASAVVLGLILIFPGIFIASTIRVKGGEYRMVQALMGTKLSGIFVWNFIVTQVALSMTGLAMGNYVNAIFPQIPINTAAFVTISVFFVINLFGLKAMSQIQNILVILLLAALIVFIAFGMPNLSPGSFDLTSEQYFTGGVSGFISAVVLLSSSTTSHQLMFGLGGAASNARKTLPKALIITSCIIFFVYGLVGFVASNVMPLSEVAGKTLVVVAQEILPAPVYIFFMICGPMLAICSTFNGIFPSVAWTMHAAAEDGWFPAVTKKVNRFGAPYWFLLILYLVASVPVLLGFTIVNATNLMLFVIYINKILILIGAFRLPTKYPNLWKQSIMHIPNGLYYILIALCSILQVITVIISGLDMGMPTLITAVTIMIIFSCCALIRSKHVQLNYTEEDLK